MLPAQDASVAVVGGQVASAFCVQPNRTDGRHNRLQAGCMQLSNAFPDSASAFRGKLVLLLLCSVVGPHLNPLQSLRILALMQHSARVITFTRASGSLHLAPKRRDSPPPTRIARLHYAWNERITARHATMMDMSAYDQ